MSVLITDSTNDRITLPSSEASSEAHLDEQAARAIDGLRAHEFSRLDAARHTYADYTGGGLYPASLVRRHARLLEEGLFGNPHSTNPTSTRSTELLERCRAHVLAYFNASPDEYALVFTANASGALKLVGESYPFDRNARLLLTFDNHNSVVGIREFARARGARTDYVPVMVPDMRADQSALDRLLDDRRGQGSSLFAYPAQSNFSGVHHPLTWIELAQERGWQVLLDAAAFVPTNRLDLGRWHPDFVVLSFYKMFGYPTGVGVLLARRTSLDQLQRPWFAGGTITVASVQADRHYLAPGSAAFEEGTASYLAVPAVDFGLDFLESVGIDVIHRRVRSLTGGLLGGLLALRHGNGLPVVRLYGPPDLEQRGGTVAFNLQDSAGRLVDHRVVEGRANAARISLRTGCFCNPGAGELALGLSKDELEGCLLHGSRRMTIDHFRQCITGKGSGAVRISLGLASNLVDVEVLLAFVREFLDA
jgi:molybdenum cofactor sulfurtransferase